MIQMNDKPHTLLFRLRIILIILLVGVLLVTPIIPSDWVNKPPEPSSEGNDGGGIPLFRPPIHIVGVYADAPAITTTDVALFGWLDLYDEYGQINGWDIYDAPGVMLNYTDQDNAIDGWVRVWDKGSQYVCTDENPDYDNCYVDVQVRVRTDYVIMAYILETQTDAMLERGISYLWWNHSLMSGTDPSSDYTLAPSRAMEIVLVDGLNITYDDPPVAFTLDYSDINYYDFEFPNAERLFVFGYTKQYINLGSGGEDIDSHFFYFTVEAGSTVENAVAIHGSWGKPNYDGAGNNVTSRFEIDDYFMSRLTIEGTCTAGSLGWFGHDINNYVTPGVQTTAWIYTYNLRPQAGCGYPPLQRGITSNIAVLVWTG